MINITVQVADDEPTFEREFDSFHEAEVYLNQLGRAYESVEEAKRELAARTY